MSLQSLICHPACVAPSEMAIFAGAVWHPNGDLQIDYRLQGAIETLRVPPPVLPSATDGLWQYTCCEAFVATVDALDYREFNFSPSACWAAYRFDNYRQRDASWAATDAPQITFGKTAETLTLTAVVPASLLPDAAIFDLGLTVVLETQSGDKTYWALTHRAAQPDFHLRDSFTFALKRP